MNAIKLIIDQLAVSPWKSLFILLLSLLAGILEGASVALLVPLLEIIINEDVSNTSKYEYLNYFMEIFKVRLSSASLLVLFCFFITLKSLFSLAAMNYIGKVIAELTFDMREKFINGLLHSKWTFINTKKSGELLNAINFEIPKAASVYRYSCVILATLFQVTVLFIVLYNFSISTVVGGIILGLVLFLSLGFYVRSASEQSRLQVNIMNSMISKIHEMLNGIKVIKAMNLINLVHPIILSKASAIKIATQKQIVAKHGLTYLREPIVVIFLSLGIYLSLKMQSLSPEILFASLVLFLRLASSIGKLQSDYQVFLVNSHYFLSFKGKLDEFHSNEESLGDGAREVKFESDIEYNDVSYSHDETIILKDSSFKFPSIGFVSIIGASGAGKTTLADMLLKLYEPNHGAIYIDNENLKNICGNVVRDQVGYVQQESFIFNDSVFMNVGLGDTTISREDVVVALKAAHAYQFVSKMKSGIDTNLGESGSKISGGQKQRISIARALVRKPKILILDEATSALDKKTMLDILDIIKEESKSMLVIAITHQQEVLDRSDYIYSLEDQTLELLP